MLLSADRWSGFAFAPLATLIALNIAISMFYLGNFIFKGILVSVGGGRSADIDETIAIEARALREEDLPVFTVLVPMFREGSDAAAAGAGACAISTIRSASSTSRSCSKPAIARPSRPRARSVSKACSKSSRAARPSRRPSRRPATSRCVSRAANIWSIYDAEDRPEPDQLRKVVATFRRSPPNTACLQCRLNYYNASENWLTRMFTLDYALWFDQVLPGLERLGMPIPLGGTSNHFRIDVLRELHAWDPFNVTEDADLGIRIGQKGYRVGVVDSTTFEEASCRRGQWIRQRSRWIKGYMQTLLVHTRRPLHFIRSAGPLGFLGFVFFIGGTVLAGLLNPLFWAALSRSGSSAAAASFDPLFPPILLFLCLFNLLAGNGAFTYLIMLAPIRRGWLDLIPVQLHAVRLLGADFDRRL